ncbi:MAG: heavy-metal-associated domain-containing protein [Firmicutes bacterium]|nr:heavy-metal-associated domain-containing protein [Bacillota bacterium]
METLRFRVGGLKGEADRKELMHNLSRVDGVEKVAVSMGGGEVSITFDPLRAGERQLRELANTLGSAPLDESAKKLK